MSLPWSSGAIAPSRDFPRPDPVRPRLARIEAVINPASGGVGPGAPHALATIVAEHGIGLNIATPSPGELESAIRKAIDASPDLLVILAGDGTARLAAELCGRGGPLLAPLPGGTMNMLPHALYGAHPWQTALASALTEGVERPTSGGRVGGRTFYCAAILGSPALWGLAREAVRARKLKRAFRRALYAFRRAFHGGVGYALDGLETRKAEALVLITPLISRRFDEEIALEAAAMDLHDAQEVFRLALNGLVGDWRRDPGVIAGACQTAKVWAHHSIPCVLDGEVHRLPSTADIAFLPDAFRALAPPAAKRP
jgi:diacylglycerol kinase family enzyme